ncbi:MAG: hypothetical protein IT455_04525 [Planctomycetes bacterium]|nr:hypothetical protein [Planctomycetota bacterium]
MTKSTVSERDVTATALREPRPFLHLEPARLPVRDSEPDTIGLARLDAAAAPSIPALVRSLVDHTIARQNRRGFEVGNPQPIQVSVLNRRRRAARSWLLAILAGKVDGATRHAVASQWLPVLTGSGPELGRLAHPARQLIEFLRGAITACIFDEARDNLLTDARALHVLEATLAVHLAAVQQTARAARSAR